MKANRFWIASALTGLAVLATASIGSSARVGGQDKQATDSGSTLGEAGMPFCFGDGTAGKCPGLQMGERGRGCENSLGLGGGLLMGRGSARLCEDNLELAASYLPVPTTVVFLESADADVRGPGLAFGDGLMCLTKSVRRIAIRQPRDLGMANYPMFGDPPLSIAGKVSMIQPTRYYQVMYRDSAVIGRENRFNLTNALMVVWGP